MPFKQLKLGELADQLPEMAAKEVWLAGLGHLIAQKRQSFTETEENSVGMLCLYSGFGGCTCAAGPFIKNYDEKMESESWPTLIALRNQSPKHSGVISILQSIHDNSSNWSKEGFNWELAKKKSGIPSEVVSEIDRMLKTQN